MKQPLILDKEKIENKVKKLENDKLTATGETELLLICYEISILNELLKEGETKSE